MESEYQSKFIGVSDPVLWRTYAENRQYVRLRRNADYSHSSFSNELEQLPILPVEVENDDDIVESDKSSPTPGTPRNPPVSNTDLQLEEEYRKAHPLVRHPLRLKMPDTQNVPPLVLAPTPSPERPSRQERPLSPKKLHFISPPAGSGELPESSEFDVYDREVQTHDSVGKQFARTPVLISRAVQTPERWLSHRAHRSDELHEEDLVPASTGAKRRSRSPARNSFHKLDIAPRRARTRSPFASYGAGDKELLMAHKRTFNVKSSAKDKEIYDSALNAARARNIPVIRNYGCRSADSRAHVGRRLRSADYPKVNPIVSESSRVRFKYPMTEYQRQFRFA